MVLFFHELSHLELCHLQFLKDELGLTEHQEVAAAPQLSKEQASLFRALEWDADNAALMSSLKMWRSFCANLDHSAIEPLGPARSWFLAAQLLFWVMDFVQPAARRGLLATHPSPKARLVNAAMVAKSFGFVPELSEARTSETDSLVPWIVRNKFPSHTVGTVGHSSFVDDTVQELAESRDRYERIMAQLKCHQEHRLAAKERAVST